MEEAIAFNYYTIIEESGHKSLSVELWIKYIQLANNLTGSNIPLKKGCINRLKQAHLTLSDYFKKI